jgi:FAD/FMN-containing dehydrogenase
LDEGQKVIKPIRDLGPLLDIVGPIPYAQGVQRLIEPGNPPGMQNYWKAEFLEELTDEAIDTLIEHVNRGQSPLSSVILEPLGGALARVDEDAMALGNRQAPYAFHCIAMWSDPSEADIHVGWAKDLASAMDRFATAGIYLNYTSDQENPERVRSTYGSKYDRLVALKDEYDPDNVFCLNPNIKPSGS